MDLLQNEFNSKLIRISAHDRDFNRLNESNSQFEINLPSNTRGMRQVIASVPISFHCTNLFYNVTDAQFLFNDGISDKVVTVSDGQYTIDEFMAAFVTSYNAVTGLAMVYLPTTDANPDIDPITAVIDLDFKQQITFTASDENNIGIILGFSFDNVEYTTDGAGLITSPYPVDISGVDAVYLHSRSLSTGATDLDTKENVEYFPYLQVPLDAAFGCPIFWKSTSNASFIHKYVTPRDISSIAISLRDNRGRLLNVQNSDWSLLLKVYYLI